MSEFTSLTLKEAAEGLKSRRFSSEEITRAHVEAIRPGGMVAISVPNAHCLPYRLNKWQLEARGAWPWGFEQPFTRAELDRIARGEMPVPADRGAPAVTGVPVA